MLAAPVGDDVYAADPSVRTLEERVADLLGKEDAVYMVTGSMANQVALRSHTESGDRIVMEAGGHVFLSEGGAPAALSGLSVHQIPGHRGLFTVDQFEAALPRAHAFTPKWLESPVRLVCLENTHNLAGGVVLPIDGIRAITDSARLHGVASHLDGARLWNACAATGLTPSDYASCFDTVSVCFSKGLGAPMGSVLAGTRELIDRARRFKQLFGGGWRQAGIMAAGALFAMENHRDRLAEDHANAALFADGLLDFDGVEVDRQAVETNIVRFTLSQTPAAKFVDQCHADGVHLLPSGKQGVRTVFHMDVSREQTKRALDVVRGAAVS